MSRASILLCVTLLAATVAGAQTMRPIQIQPIQNQVTQPAPVVAPAPATQVAPPAQELTQVVAPTPIGPVQTVEALSEANRQLRETNRQLQAENAALKAQLSAMTTLGGSQVHAFCPTDTISRNTAGAEANCGASGYKCEDVSGLCHKTCSSSDQCASGHSCNPCNNKCEGNGGPITQC